MRISFTNPLKTEARNIVSKVSPDLFVDDYLLKELEREKLEVLVKAAKEKYPNQVQNYLGSLLADSKSSIDKKIKVASILGLFNTQFSARILGSALNGFDVNAGDLFNAHMTSVFSINIDDASVGETTLGDLLPNSKREKDSRVIKELIEALGNSSYYLAVLELRKYSEHDRPFANIARTRAESLDKTFKGCFLSPFTFLTKFG